MLQNTIKILNALIYTIRPSATLGACLLVFAAFNPSGNDWGLITPLMLATFFGSAFCFLINDIIDKEKDLKNNKKRPMATGVIPMSVAITVTILCALIFIVSTYFLGELPFWLSFVFLVLAYGYSYVNLRVGLLANALVAFMVSGTQWGVYLIKPDEILIWTSLILFFFTIPRELLLDWLDRLGDKEVGKSSAPLYYSPARNKLIIAFFLSLSSLSLITLLLTADFTIYSSTLLIITSISSWVSFAPFMYKPDNRKALLCVRLSHSTFALLILTMLTR